MDEKEISEREPHIKGIKALYSPSTGIINSHEFMANMQRESEDLGAVFCFNTVLESVTYQENNLITVQMKDKNFNERYDLDTDVFINATGLLAPLNASKWSNLANIPKPMFAKGYYFKLKQTRAEKEAVKFNHLIYPVPFKNIAGLGVHLTLDLEGNVKFGPDIEWIDEIDYSFSEENAKTRAEQFHTSIRSYFPDIKHGSLIPDYTGIRPKLSNFDGKEQDFVIMTENGNTAIHLLGIDSPGLTASLAIAEEVTQKISS